MLLPKTLHGAGSPHRTDMSMFQVDEWMRPIAEHIVYGSFAVQDKNFGNHHHSAGHESKVCSQNHRRDTVR